MKANKILAATLLLASGLSLGAQETVTEYTFIPHWFVQGQAGAQETLGEGSFGNMLSPNAQIAAGYMFNPYIGARLSLGGWQSKGANDIQGPIYQHQYNWKWNYVAPTVSLVANMTNVLAGYNPERPFDVNLFAGVGTNFGFNNKEANDANADYKQHTGVDGMLRNCWDGTKTLFTGQVGLGFDYKLSENWALGLEVNATALSDKYNSKKAPNADWYFNGLVGVKYTIGPSYKKTVREIVPPAPQIIERVVERIVEVPVPAAVPEVVESKPEVQSELRRDIFFKIGTTGVTEAEMPKVAEIAEFLKANPEATVVLTGYADRGTGSKALNARLCQRRAQVVADVLVKKYGVARKRITAKAMGANEPEPFSTPAENRVTVAICK